MPNPALPAPPTARIPKQRLRALIVEDSEFDCSVLVRRLGQAGFAVSFERVEEEGAMRDALATQPWDVIISDHNLPHFSSTRALEVFKSSALDVPFIIVSGEIGEDVAVEAMLAGADDYVLKSRLTRLAPALHRSLADADSRRRRREAEEQLRTSEARLRSITANLPGMVFRIAFRPADGAWSFEHASEGAQRLFGVPPAALLADRETFLGLLEPGSRDGLLEAMREATPHMASLRWQGRLVGLEPQEPRWIELACGARMRDADTLLWEGVIMDISAQKAAEEAALRSREELREVTLHFERVKEEERKAIAREVHDDIGSILTSLRFDLTELRVACATQPAVAQRAERMAELIASARQASERIMRNLRPSILDQGIVPALEWLARDFGARYAVACRFAANRDTVDLNEAQRMTLFRVCQEALTNVARHARANSVHIELFASNDNLVLEIADDGVGLAPDAFSKSGHFGIRGMRERAAALDGWIEVEGAPGHGTTVMISLPLVPHPSVRPA
ncbi:MAG: response regulator [Betaproteobacteria bacterium]|nr:response regulator [Betaproteobacteria bacterium]